MTETEESEQQITGMTYRRNWWQQKQNIYHCLPEVGFWQHTELHFSQSVPLFMLDSSFSLECFGKLRGGGDGGEEEVVDAVINITITDIITNTAAHDQTQKKWRVCMHEYKYKVIFFVFGSCLFCIVTVCIQSHVVSAINCG